MSNVDKATPVIRKQRFPLTDEEKAKRKKALEDWGYKHSQFEKLTREPFRGKGRRYEQ